MKISLNSLLAVIASIFGIILFADWCWSQYSLSFPEISPKEQSSPSSSPPRFVIKNVSPYFWMKDVHLVCGIETASFDIGEGRNFGIWFPVTSGSSNPAIAPGNSAEYRCDPSDYLKTQNGRISLFGLTTEHPIENLSAIRLIAAETWIGVTYKTFWWPSERQTISHHWRLNPNTFKWEEIRPVYIERLAPTGNRVC